MAEFATIVADPPWSPELGGTWGARVDKGRPQRFYQTMTLADIKALDVPAARQAHLYLWAITPHVDWGFEVARAWGFDPVTMLTWCKPGLGVGRFRCNTEHVIVARKGSRHGNPFGQGGRHQQATDGTWFEWPRGRHSEKPAEFYDLVERISPGPYLEMFARSRRPGWSAWGNEVESDVLIGTPLTGRSEAAESCALCEVCLSCGGSGRVRSAQVESNRTNRGGGPRHEASDRCESGKRPHCSCEVCF